ncbi:MAG: aminotransferase class IV [Salinivirgaceae bacterium]|jgi:branched-subunit amino acid aminotransferase/4-amino-4-deoxychorismate lyase|nr:aminotransferase class IV [Salinivirgaceae bacterium]
MIGFNNGKYEQLENINIPITSLSINRGYGAFEFFQIINGKPFYGERHLARLKNTLKELRIFTEFENELPQIIDNSILKNKLNDCYIKIFVLPHSADNVANYSGSLYVFPTEMPVYDDALYKNGGSLLLRNYQRDMPLAKSTSYLFGQFMQNDCFETNAIEVLYYNGTTIQETVRGNIFIVRNGFVHTPFNNVLKGITRSIVIDILKENSYQFTEKEITIEELFAADEVFITSTTKNVMPIVEIHKHTIVNGNPGEMTQQIMREFQKVKELYNLS